MSADELKAAYAELDIAPGSGRTQVKKAHRLLAKVWHPDRFEADPELRASAEKRLARINNAAELIRRSGYPPASESEPRAGSAYRAPPRQPAPPPATPATFFDGDAGPGHFVIAACVLVGVVVIGVAIHNSEERDAASRARAAHVEPTPSAAELPTPAKSTASAAPAPPPFANTPEHLKGDAIPAELPRVGSSQDPALGLFITIGTTRAQVEAVQGTPNKVDKSYGETWWYADSRVEFSSGKVTGWNQGRGDPLQVGWSASKTARAELAVLRGYVVVGSTRDEVAALHGPPSQLEINYSETWWYGASRFEFSRGLVRGWDISPSRSLKVRTAVAHNIDVAKLRSESIATPAALAPEGVKGEVHFPEWKRDPANGSESWNAVFYFHDDKAGYAMLAVSSPYADGDTYVPLEMRGITLYLVVDPELVSQCSDATLLVGGEDVHSPNMVDKVPDRSAYLKAAAAVGLLHNNTGRVANGASVSLVVCGRVFSLRKKDAKALQELAKNALLGVRGNE